MHRNILLRQTDYFLVWSRLAHAFEEFGHRSWRVGYVLLDPSNREIRMRFFHSRQCSARFLKSTRLSQTGNVDTCSPRHSRPCWKRSPAGSHGVIISSRHIMANSHPDIEDRVLWIVRAHSKRLLEVDHRFVELSVKSERPAEITMSCREVRVEL